MSSRTLRFASFNLSFSRPRAGQLLNELEGEPVLQFANCAEILQRVRPDVLLLNEFDQDGPTQDDRALSCFLRRYLAIGQGGAAPLDYPFHYLVPTNTGLGCGMDLDGDGVLLLPQDAHGFGAFHGQYAMLVLSRFPLARERVRSFQTLRWADMPGALLPDRQPGSGLGDYYGAEALAVLRLSSKNHLDLPVRVGGRIIHFLVSHPCPPVFDGPEQRNRRRNHDELRLWLDYLDDAAYLLDDQGRRGGLPGSASFVLAGDLNADPYAGAGLRRAIRRLLGHPRMNASAAQGMHMPCSEGARALARQRGLAEADAACWTHMGGLRLDYVLPSRDLQVLDSGVYWPAPGEPRAYLVADEQGRQQPGRSSDHRLVWVDVVC